MYDLLGVMTLELPDKANFLRIEREKYLTNRETFLALAAEAGAIQRKIETLSEEIHELRIAAQWMTFDAENTFTDLIEGP